MRKILMIACLAIASWVNAQPTMITNEGAWCWFADPRATHYENAAGTINASYIGYIDVHGNVKATQVDFLRNQQEEMLVRSCFQPDDHNFAKEGPKIIKENEVILEADSRTNA